MQHDVREARQAVQEVVDTDKLLRGICLTESAARDAASHSAAVDDSSPASQGRKPREGSVPAGPGPADRRDGDEHLHQVITPHMRLAGGLLESYERQIHSVEGALKVLVLPRPQVGLECLLQTCGAAWCAISLRVLQALERRECQSGARAVLGQGLKRGEGLRIARVGA